MQTIIKGCKNPSDVVSKKAKFYQDLKLKGIIQEEPIDYYKIHSNNIEGAKVLEALKKQSEENKKLFNESECDHYLKLFTKINALRRGVSNKGFERIGHILMSGNGVAHFLAHNPLVKVNEKDLRFAYDIDFVTNKFWFKLKKGFHDKQNLPKSFDIITKAQIIMSAQLKNTVAKEYTKLGDKFKRGELTKEQAISINYELRDRVKRPEEIVPEIIDDSLVFLNEQDNIERHLREKSMLLQMVEEGDAAKQELRKKKSEEWVKKKKWPKRFTRLEFYLLMSGLFLVLGALLAGIVYFIYKLSMSVSNLTDSLADIMGLGSLLLSQIFTFIKFRRIIRWIYLRTKDKYKSRLATLRQTIT